MAGMKLSVIHKTSVFRGDHSADARVAIDVPDETTLIELARQYLVGRSNTDDRVGDVIEIRLCAEREGGA